jgi:hypothetical protein
MLTPDRNRAPPAGPYDGEGQQGEVPVRFPTPTVMLKALVAAGDALTHAIGGLAVTRDG